MNNHKRRKFARVQEFEESLNKEEIVEQKEEVKVEVVKVEEPATLSSKKKKIAIKEEVKTEE